ncbi:hypothetical protein BsIDN1_20550 [Bacillus safensis]|uniref:Uncharacterized protein n=1 Tax=Bacillus safensis TaxID=561879 RepID=A0A5S9M4L0_BACIA|nr:hypothetical protein BsIDN1_20550 [Bacillus safensis]
MKEVGHYHFWTALFSSIAIMLGGLFADFFTVYFFFMQAPYYIYAVHSWSSISKTKDKSACLMKICGFFVEKKKMKTNIKYTIELIFYTCYNVK